MDNIFVKLETDKNEVIYVNINDISVLKQGCRKFTTILILKNGETFTIVESVDKFIDMFNYVKHHSHEYEGTFIYLHGGEIVCID